VERLKGEVTGTSERNKELHFYSAQLSSDLADARRRLESASNPRHVVPCDDCGHPVEVPCNLATEPSTQTGLDKDLYEDVLRVLLRAYRAGLEEAARVVETRAGIPNPDIEDWRNGRIASLVAAIRRKAEEVGE
jgi:hypothetical protein